jgi:hypothetical protein
MERTYLRFEDLPNELILEICRYLDAREVFQSFLNVNNRMKNLLQSFDHLQLTVSLFDSKEKRNYHDFFPYIRTLIIDRGISINLKYFQKLHHLILHNPQNQIFQQLNHHTIPYLEYISITHKLLTSTIRSLVVNLFQNILSNHFPHLKSCNLPLFGTSLLEQNRFQSLSLTILKVGQINLSVYQIILSSCPNLYFLQFEKCQSIESSSNITIHTNLQQMIIADSDQTFPWNDKFIHDYLLFVPNLEKLTIHRRIYFDKMNEYLNYNWFTTHSLHLLQRLNLILNIYSTQRFTKCYIVNLSNALKEYVLFLHKNRYEIRLKFIYE